MVLPNFKPSSDELRSEEGSDIDANNPDSDDADCDVVKEWEDALGQRHGQPSMVTAGAKSKAKQNSRRKEDSQLPFAMPVATAHVQNENAPGQPSVPQPYRVFIDPSNQRVLADFKGGSRRALGHLTKTN